MAQEFTIKSADIEDKINQLLPSQGGFQPGVDFSASTMVVPIVDLTETAEGSGLRIDLQKAYTHTNVTHTRTTNALSTITNTTCYYLVKGVSSVGAAGTNNVIDINDGTTNKSVFDHFVSTGSAANSLTFEFIVKLEAGDTLFQFSSDANNTITSNVRQVADLQGNLITP
jgi:hypothetical protein